MTIEQMLKKIKQHCENTSCGNCNLFYAGECQIKGSPCYWKIDLPFADPVDEQQMDVYDFVRE